MSITTKASLVICDCGCNEIVEITTNGVTSEVTACSRRAAQGVVSLTVNTVSALREYRLATFTGLANGEGMTEYVLDVDAYYTIINTLRDVNGSPEARLLANVIILNSEDREDRRQAIYLAPASSVLVKSTLRTHGCESCREALVEMGVCEYVA